MDLVFSFKDINPNNEPEWTCPHCSRVFATSRTHYYNSHHGGRCLLSAGQQATAHKGIEQLLTEDGAYIDELGNEYTGEAALAAELDADQVLGLECQQGDADAALNAAAAAATCSVVGPGEVVTGTMWDDLQVSACRLLQT
jgi:hypothetical protein